MFNSFSKTKYLIRFTKNLQFVHQIIELFYGKVSIIFHKIHMFKKNLHSLTKFSFTFNFKIQQN